MNHLSFRLLCIPLAFPVLSIAAPMPEKPMGDYTPSPSLAWQKTADNKAQVTFIDDSSGVAIVGNNPLNTNVSSPLIYFSTQADNCFSMQPKGQYRLVTTKINDNTIKLINICKDNETALLVPAKENDRLVMLWNAVLRDETRVNLHVAGSDVLLAAGKYTNKGFRVLYERIFDQTLEKNALQPWAYNPKANNAIAPVYTYFFGSSVGITDNGKGGKIFNMVLQVGDACTARSNTPTRYRGFRLDNTDFNMNVICINEGHAMLLPRNDDENMRLLNHLRLHKQSVIYGGGTLGKIGTFSNAGFADAMKQVRVH